MANRITIQVVGAMPGRALKLVDLLEQLTAVRRALREMDIALSPTGLPTLDYKVVGLHHSEATVAIEPFPITGNVPKNYAGEVVRSFSSELRLIKKEKKLVMPPQLDRLTAYGNIGTAKGNCVGTVRVAATGKVITIDAAFKKNAEEIVGPDELSEGSVSGKLEALNFHNTNRFTIYPNIGPRTIHGTFEPRLRKRVKEAIGNFVTVYGALRFKAWADWPHGIVAAEIDIHQADRELPTLTELRGAFKGLTGDLSSVAFVEKLRNEDWKQ